MENIEGREGYKKTELGWVPEEWDVCKLEAIFKEVQYGLSEEINHKGTYPILRMNNLNNGKIDISNLKYINIDDKIFEKFKLYKNDILFNRTNSADLVGKTSIFTFNGDFVFASYLLRLKINLLIAFPSFINYFFNWSDTQNKLKKIASKGVSQSNINPNNLKNILIQLPPLPEQQKIAEILSNWDKAIEKTEKLINAKNQLKKGLIQKLLTGKKRFKEFEGKAWKKLKLSDFLIPSLRPVEKPDKNYLALGIRSHGKGTFLKPESDPAKIEMTTLYQVKENDLIVSITFAWEAAIAITKKEDEGALVSHRFPTYIFNRNIVIHEYFKYVILQKSFVYKLGLISPGGAGRNRVLDKKDFEDLIITVPCLEEQQKIASVLSTCDREIELLENKLKSIKDQKKGLMQKLLTGQIRVSCCLNRDFQDLRINRIF